MFCPSCGLKDNNSNQYCRSCGTDLGSVTTALEGPEKFTASAVSAREEIGRALAAKIQRTESSSDLSKFAKKILPEVEKFLETPEERKMRRIRNGSIVSFVGVGIAIGFLLAGIFVEEEMFIAAAFGLVTLCVGVALLVNGVHFSLPSEDSKAEDLLDAPGTKDPDRVASTTNELLMPPSARQEFSSVTEETTRHLKDKKPV
ncbi:MAG: zinc ribbon domain-containing protein [Pyrinomonadaceae bacterium]|nr:zinc ribbon domain-containing protein [Pyrinomonadaceae bacterium]